ncbi:WD repeat-containing protein C2orf86, partial [Danaus plexippus plexippus]
YETKKKLEESVYDVGKRNYLQRRGGHWQSPRPRQLRQLESKIHDTNIVFSQWMNDNCITLMFSSGVIAYITVKSSTLDITHILFDRYCVGRLSGSTVTGVAFCKTLLFLTHTDKTATLITFGKCVDNNTPCQISDRDPHLQSIELGGSGRRTERHVSWCESDHVRLLVWGAAVAEPAPWSPIIEDHANLHLYQVTSQQFTLLAYHQIENEVLLAELSHRCDNIIHIVDQTACHKSGVTLSWVRYDLPPSPRAVKLSSLRDRVSGVSDVSGVSAVSRASLPAPARVARRSPCDARLVVACIDASIHILHTTGLTHTVRAGFRVQILATHGMKGGPLILASFNGGPLTILRITHARLITAYIRSNRIPNAVALLRAMDWEEEGSECLNAMSDIVRNALRKGSLGENGEVGVQIALGAYLAPTNPLPISASKYAPAVHDLARKFFHHLLRRGRIEKALSLAVDLAAWDLFVDARWAAKRQGLQHLVEEASSCATHYARMERPDSECSDSCSQCSSYSGSEDGSSTSSKAVPTKPPPLPRVPLPSNPSILAVPKTQHEPYTTNSIRPNLHQYLERDTTIWGKNIKDDSYIMSSYRNVQQINNNNRWNSLDDVLSVQRNPTSSYKNAQTDIQRSHDERIASHFKQLFQTELKEEAKMKDRYLQSVSSGNGRYQENYWPGQAKPEKNKVKFSDTVTIAVVSEPPVPDPARELAASLPLCPPHKYLSAFAPSENAVQKPPKIKVVHFGMV